MLDHSFALVAPEIAAGSYIDFARLEIGRLAVDVFFIVSGFLVTRSVMTQPRFLRLFPALFVATIFIAFVLGPLVTTASLHDYFGDSRPWIYVPLTASLITHSLTLPGVFETVPEAGVIAWRARAVGGLAWACRCAQGAQVARSAVAQIKGTTASRRAGASQDKQEPGPS
ncbi:MAG TPA: hypothetical protein VHK26_05845 [Methyloceanibacter sp.]|nr:hypothetical protein [Methyloceanibacter sp.]